ncbi:hypothetical protein Lal_00033858 [Lupinus albus]|nr:hypothetical protein Lal_00033858 [Lupinus albus]
MMCAKVKIIHTIKRTKPPFVCVSTRGNTGHLHPINPEIDRTYHRLVRQSRNLPFHSVPDSVSDSDSISNFIPVSVHSVQYTDFVHSVALSDSEHSENSVHSENMAQPPTPPGPPHYNPISENHDYPNLREFWSFGIVLGMSIK